MWQFTVTERDRDLKNPDIFSDLIKGPSFIFPQQEKVLASFRSVLGNFQIKSIHLVRDAILKLLFIIFCDEE